MGCSLQQGSEISGETLDLLGDQSMRCGELFDWYRRRQQGNAGEQKIDVPICGTASARRTARFFKTLAEKRIEQIVWLARVVGERHWIEGASTRNQIV